MAIAAIPQARSAAAPCPTDEVVCDEHGVGLSVRTLGLKLANSRERLRGTGPRARLISFARIASMLKPFGTCRHRPCASASGALSQTFVSQNSSSIPRGYELQSGFSVAIREFLCPLPSGPCPNTRSVNARMRKRRTGEGGCGKSLILQLRHPPKKVSLWIHLWLQRSPHWQEPP
jgi:hypothetical protein